MLSISFIVIFIGFIIISLSMKRHSSQILSDHNNLSASATIVLRLIGYFCLIIAGYLCIESLGIGLGLVYWTGFLTLAALLQSFLLTYRSRWILSSGLIAILAGVFLGVMY